MIEGDGPLGLAGLTVPLVGAVLATGVPFEPYRLADPAGEAVSPVTVFLADLQACGRAAATQRSYSMALLRWFRFLWAVEVPMGSGHAGGGTRFRPVGSGRWQAGSSALAR